MQPEDWDSGFGRSVGVFLNGDGIQGKDDRGRRITDVNFLLYFNAHDDDVEFTLPADEYAPAWDVIIDTAGAADADTAAGGVTGRRSRWWCCAPTARRRRPLGGCLRRPQPAAKRQPCQPEQYDREAGSLGRPRRCRQGRLPPEETLTPQRATVHRATR